MKKFAVLASATVLMIALAACGNTAPAPSASPSPEASPVVEEVTPSEEASEAPETSENTESAEGLYRPGSSAVVKQPDFDENGWKQFVEVEIGADGKISAVNWDAENKDGGKTKKEVGEEYGLKAASPIGKEYYEQAAAIEAELIRVQDPTLIVVNAEGQPDGVTGCTIDVTDFISLAYEALEGCK